MAVHVVRDALPDVHAVLVGTAEVDPLQDPRFDDLVPRLREGW
jgi:hypothetical protein